MSVDIEYLTLTPEQPTWFKTHKGDAAVIAIARRHYSNTVDSKRSGQIGGPGRTCVLLTPCRRAAWITKYNVGGGNMDGFDAFRCGLFRNEGAGLSSSLILAAMQLTERLWPERPVDGWLTWVDPRKVNSQHPGYCFLMAGWEKAGYTKSGLLRLRRWFVSQTIAPSE